jgi:hypothetical protein
MAEYDKHEEHGESVQDERDWAVRQFVFEFAVARERMPAPEEIVPAFAITPEEARAALSRLHERHALFLDPQTGAIRMAHPLSGVPTGYRVVVGDKAYWANCAWDAFGVPAMLRSDAQIEASFPDGSGVADLRIEHGQTHGHGEIVHFSLPFARWYDDLIHT